MQLPIVDYCCCGCSLRTGTIIIGVLGLIGSVISGLVAGFGIVAVEFLVNNPDVQSPGADQIRAAETALLVLFIALIIFSVISFIINVVLLIGANQNKARYVRIWVTVSLVLLVTQLGLTVLEFFVNPQPTVYSRIFASLIQFYYIIVVNSFYKEMSQNGTVE